MSCLVLLIGCSSSTAFDEKSSVDVQSIVDSISIEMHNTKSGTIDSFQASVKEFNENKRIVGSMKIKPDYRLSIKRINNVVHTRIDFTEDHFGDGKQRTIISNDKESVLFDTKSKVVEARIPLDNTIKDDTLQSRHVVLSKFNVSDVLEKSKKRLFDIAEDKKSNTVCLTIPPDSLNIKSRNNTSTKKNIFSKMYFDIVNEVLLGTETQEIDEEGTVVTLSNNFLYMETDGYSVLVGEIQESHYDIKNPIDTSEYVFPIINSVDEIENITQEELQKISDDGGQITEFEQILGDPSDPDYTNVTVKIFNNIVINGTEDSYFRIPL